MNIKVGDYYKWSDGYDVTIYRITKIKGKHCTFDVVYNSDGEELEDSDSLFIFQQLTKPVTEDEALVWCI